MSWQPPTVFDDFEILRFLGAGGMGTVYLARDTALGRELAIKFVSQSTADPLADARFFVEARAIARLHHANVVSVYRVGFVDRRPYLAYEYVDGKRLDELPRPMDWQRALSIGVGLARGLAAAHKVGVLHRDIKPANVMITAAGEVKLLDFGMAKLADVAPPAATPSPHNTQALLAGKFGRRAPPGPRPQANLVSSNAPTLLTPVPSSAPGDNRLTQVGTVVGTPLYMAPELWIEAVASERSDIYALGMVLYELLAGKLPLAHLSVEELAWAAITKDTPSLEDALPNLPRALTRLIDRCVRREVDERPRSAAEVRDALEGLASLYRPFIGDDGDDEREAAMLAASFVRVQGAGDRFAPHFYDRWFRADPDARPLFRSDLAQQQQRMLAAALKLAIDNLRSPERLVPLLEDLGRRHARYGVRAEQFSTMGHALMGSLAELDPEWSPALERGWSTAIARITQVVQRSSEAERASKSVPVAAVGRAALDLPLAQPHTQWARRDDAEVAYQVFGNGPIDVLVIGEWVTHVEQMWRHPAPAALLRRLAGFARVIVFDRRGCGLSDRATPPTLDTAIDDVLAVLEATSSDQPAVIGIGDGALIATVLAATDPTRVRALALLGAGARMAEETGGDARARLEQAQAQVRDRWGGPLFVDALAPSLAVDPEYRRWWAATLRNGASPAAARRLLDLAASLDIGPVAPAVHARTLLVHRTDDAVWPIDQARKLAAAIPGARLLELPGADHAPWSGDVEAVLAPVHEFLAQAPTAAARGVVIATALAVELRASSRANATLDEAARRAFTRHQGVALPGAAGRQIAVFDAPGRALACARALALTMRVQGHTLAIGVETGELSGDVELTGPVVERAVDLAGAAASGEIAIGPVTRALVGSADMS